MKRMKYWVAATLLGIFLILGHAGCSVSSPTYREQTMGGGALGGALIGGLACGPWAALCAGVGALAGGTGGYLYGDHAQKEAERKK